MAWRIARMHLIQRMHQAAPNESSPQSIRDVAGKVPLFRFQEGRFNQLRSRAERWSRWIVRLLVLFRFLDLLLKRFQCITF